MTTGPRVAAAAALSLLFLTSGVAAQEDLDADEFCRRAGRNQAIFELSMDKATAQAGTVPGSVSCSWTFSGRSPVAITLESRLLSAPVAARQEILMGRLPERNRGKTLVALKIGDDALGRATAVDGVTRLYEIEAVKGRRHFRMTVRPLPPDSGLNFRIQAFSGDFLAAGIKAVSR
jgi:hypothetical protein